MRKWILFLLCEVALVFAAFNSLIVRESGAEFVYYIISGITLAYIFYKYFCKKK